MDMGWVHPWVGLPWVGLGQIVAISVQHRNRDRKTRQEEDLHRPLCGPSRWRDGASSSEHKSTVATVCTSVQDELARYKALKVPAASHVLLYWKYLTSEYPTRSRVARRLFCIPASSAQSDRDFSPVGRTITDARSQLSASKVEDIERDLMWTHSRAVTLTELLS